MDVKAFFKHWFVKNVIIAIVAVLVFVVGVSFLLGVITKHGKVVEVPDFTNMTLAQAEQTAAAVGIRTVVYDSVYVRKMTRGAVFSQNPKAGGTVKPGRKIALTINAVNAKKISMPDLVGFSLRQARAELSAKGLYLGKIIYTEDIATDNVLKQLYRNREIREGRKIDSGSTIDLVVGLNSNDEMTYIPDVSGMRYLRAVDAIHDNSLNIGRLRFDKDIRTYTDSLNATVYKQTPEASEMPIIKGEDVTLYLKLDKE
ncbi:MAG: PASTA domain-containing protein [Bacteroidales bacterium]|nr:PASTA domain-containing protein [Bacteroidales bacterium]